MCPKEIFKKKTELAKEIVQLRQEIDKLSLYCDHDWQYESDPAGGHDSGYYCWACDSFKKRIK